MITYWLHRQVPDVKEYLKSQGISPEFAAMGCRAAYRFCVAADLVLLFTIYHFTK